MRMNQTKLALIIPVYNFADHLQETFTRLIEWRTKVSEYSLLVVFSDDASTDSSLQFLEDFKNTNSSWCAVVSAKKNLGKGGAVRSGMHYALEKFAPLYIFFTDCDFHYGLNIIHQRMIPLLSENEIVILDRSWVEGASHQKLFRKILTATFKRSISILTGVNFQDTQAGLKGFQTSACTPIFKALRLNSFSFDVEILSIALYYRFRVKQIPISFSEDHSFPITSTIRIFRTSLGMFCDLFRINWNWKKGYYDIKDLKVKIDLEIFKV